MVTFSKDKHGNLVLILDSVAQAHLGEMLEMLDLGDYSRDESTQADMDEKGDVKYALQTALGV